MPTASPFLLVLLFSMGLQTMGNQRDNDYRMKHYIYGSIGGAVDQGTRLGKEQKTAMEMAVHDFYISTCSELELHLTASYGTSGRATSARNYYFFIHL